MNKRKTTKQEERLDKLFSEFIRRLAIKKVGGCEKCKAPKYDMVKEDGSTLPAWKQLQCAHFGGRRKHSVRWDEDNAAGICGGCHTYFHANPDKATEWFRKRLGGKADLLEVRAQMSGKDIDKSAVEIYLKHKIAKLKEGK